MTADDDSKYTGFQKHFNSHTIRGRANYAKLWLSVYALAFFAWKIKRKSSRAPSKAVEKIDLPVKETHNTSSTFSFEDTIPSNIPSGILPRRSKKE